MLYFIVWYIVLALFALAALPLGWTWFRHLPDRGWGLLRPLGLMLVGFFVWFLGSLGLLRLSVGSGVAGLATLFVLGAWALHRWGGGWAALRRWLHLHRNPVLVQELFFFLLFAFWTWYRVHERWGIQHTEQPMDFAFLNAILRGGEIPPNDPWLSGFAISYYYLGYLITAQISALTTIPSGVAYNLSLTTLAAMAGTGIFSLVYNLLVNEVERWRYALVAALLAPLLLIGVSNFTGLLTMTYREGMGPDSLYNWFAVHDLTVDPATGERLEKSDHSWWWWNASRTILDRDEAGNRVEVIDEFPFFSFMLGDMHPHVLALPFAILVLGLALNALRGGFLHPPLRRGRYFLFPPESWGQGHGFGWLTLLLTLIIVGGMSPINTWDFPTAFTMMAGTWLLATLAGATIERGASQVGLWAGSAAFLGIAGLILYLPFYVGFRSQAAGIHFSPFSTMPQQYLLMFGLFWLVLVPLALLQLRTVAVALRHLGSRQIWLIAAMMALDGILLAFLLMLELTPDSLALLMAGFWLLVPLAMLLLLDDEEPTALFIAQIAGFPLLAGLVGQRWTLAMVAALLGMMLLGLWARARLLLPQLERADAPERFSTRPAIAGGSQAANAGDAMVGPASRGQMPELSLLFALGVASVGLLLTMGCEIFYIKDGFAGRMNTVFKLYYQAWTLMAVATAFGVVYLSKRLPIYLSLPWLVLFASLTVGSLWYPAEAIRTKADFDRQARWDGRFWMQESDPARFAAIEWLDRLPGQAVIVEAPGDSFRPELSTLAGWTGHSTLVGWRGHELQWRGGYEEIQRREPVIAEIYQGTSPDMIQMLLDQWNIDYVAVTPIEIQRYELSDAQIEKFHRFMKPVFQEGNVVIFGR